MVGFWFLVVCFFFFNSCWEKINISLLHHLGEVLQVEEWGCCEYFLVLWFGCKQCSPPSSLEVQGTSISTLAGSQLSLLLLKSSRGHGDPTSEHSTRSHGTTFPAGLGAWQEPRWLQCRRSLQRTSSCIALPLWLNPSHFSREVTQWKLAQN